MLKRDSLAWDFKVDIKVNTPLGNLLLPNYQMD